jgi:hypothetical protein
MPHCRIDHLVITAPSLEAGAEFVQQSLGVPLQAGGEHPRMGTHNLLLRLGDALYLEVIAVNPHAVAPDRPRWFALDQLPPDALPRLATWVVRTTGIHSTAVACPEPLGGIEAMSRGALRWQITIPADGSLPLDGIAPALIEWQAEPHPAAKLQDHGLSLNMLELCHPEPERVSRLLHSINLQAPFDLLPAAFSQTPHLVAHINTPEGLRKLSIPNP